MHLVKGEATATYGMMPENGSLVTASTAKFFTYICFGGSRLKAPAELFVLEGRLAEFSTIAYVRIKPGLLPRRRLQLSAF
jgi:hypothetical protein